MSSVREKGKSGERIEEAKRKKGRKKLGQK